MYEAFCENCGNETQKHHLVFVLYLHLRAIHNQNAWRLLLRIRIRGC